MKLYIIRHGETIWNTEDRSQGMLNSELTDLGKLQTEKLSERLSKVNFEKVYISPLGRTKQTAEIVLKNHTTEIEYMDELMEMNMGKWQGLRKEDIKEKYKNEQFLFNNKPEEYNSTGGENFFQLQKRVEKALKKITKSGHKGNILLVTHGITKKMIVAVMRGLEVKDIWSAPWMKPTALTIVDFTDNSYNIELCGDVSHYE